MAKNLEPRQERFCEEYIKDLNGTQAAIRAGYSAKGADVAAVRLLANPRIKEFVQALMDRRSARVEVKADDVLRELLRLAMVDLSKAYDDQGRLLHPKDMPEDVRRAIASIEVLEEFEGHGEDRVHIGDTTKVKFWDKPKCLEMLGRHLKLFVDKIEVGGTIKVAEAIKAARERVKRGRS